MNYEELEIVKSHGLSQIFDPNEEYRILYFYSTCEDEGGVFCTPIYLTNEVYNGWPDAGFHNERAYERGDLGWWHAYDGYVIYDKSGNPVSSYKIRPTKTNFFETVERYFLRLNGEDVNDIKDFKLPKFLEDALLHTFDEDTVKFGDHYYKLANEKIAEFYNTRS